MQKKNASFSFCIAECEDSALPLGLPKKFGEAKVTEKREQCKKNAATMNNPGQARVILHVTFPAVELFGNLQIFRKKRGKMFGQNAELSYICNAVGEWRTRRDSTFPTLQ